MKMKWIEFTEDRGAFKKGERVQKEEGAADALIAAGIAKACDAPAVDVQDDPNVGNLVAAAIKEGFDEIRKEMAPLQKGFKKVVAPNDDNGYVLGTAESFKLPAQVKKYSSLRNFKGTDSEGRTADERAYRFGMWCLANYAQHGRIQDPEREESMNRLAKRAKDMGVPLISKWVDGNDDNVATVKSVGGVVQKGSNEFTNTSSGFLVPDEFQNDLIDLREKFGVFRQNAKIVPMASDTRSDPRRRGGVLAYFVGEAQPGTQSVKSWDRVRLNTKKLMCLTKISNELNEDSVLNVADDLASEIAYAFAYTEDNCGFNGDGTGTYGGIVGATKALTNVDATVANVLGLTVATGTGYGTNYNSIVLGDFNKVVGTLPEFADTGNAKWYVSKFFWGTVMQKLAMAAGGNNVANIEAGALQKMFAGYPVVVSQALPKTSAINQVCALFGDLRQAASLGDRRSTTISISDVALNAFEQDEIAIRGTERFDINVHDVGESNAAGVTARDQTTGIKLAGPLVGLITAAS